MRESFQRIVKLLNNLTQEKIIKNFALVGGLAVSSWTVPRATKDIDFLVHLTEQLNKKNIDLLNKRIQKEFHKTEVMMDNLLGMYVIRIDDGVTIIDLIIASKNWHEKILDDLTQVNSSIFGTQINIAKPEGLIVMKMKGSSPQDIIDVKNLYELENIDKNKLFLLAKSARVDKRLRKLLTNKKALS
ncbi:MAG: nucleotidyl transferase AbiEii/AbiGii toxin family protein [Acidobacteriota bacterium]